jgi:hypothetical protein
MKPLSVAALCAALALSAGADVHAQAAPPGSTRPAVSSELQSQLAQMRDPAALRQLALKYQSEQDWASEAAVWVRLNALYRHNPTYIYNLAVAYALADDKAHGYNVLLVSQRAGLGFDLENEPRFANLHGTEVWDYLVKLHKAAREDAYGGGEVAFEIAPGDRLLESIAHDPKSDGFLLGSARDGIIWRSDRNGRLTEWAKPQGDAWWAIFDIKVDAQRGHVWATTAAIPHFKGYKAEWAGKSALLKLDLDDGSLIQAYPAPADGFPHILNGIAVSPQGQVIVAEGMRGQMFKLEGEKLEPLMAQRELNALRGLVFSADGRTLYFADYERGLFGIDLTKNSAFDVTDDGKQILYGIEGLYMYEGQLVAIQNGFVPQRVTRFKLDATGRKIEMGVPLDAAQPAFATPTLGTLVDDGLYFIANSQRSYYDSYGLRKGSMALPPVKIYRSDVRFNWDFEPPKLPDSLNPRNTD